jgi:hypothetical protein
VKAAIGQVVDSETLGGAAMHAGISGTIDFREKDDEACIERLRRLIGLIPAKGDSSHLPSLSGGRRAAAGGESSLHASESPLPVAAQPTSPQRGEVFQPASASVRRSSPLEL